MAALSSCVPSVSLALGASVVLPPRRCWNNPVTTATSALRRRGLAGGSRMNSSGMNDDSAGLPVKRDTRISAVDPGSAAGIQLPGLDLPIPPWAPWLAGAIVFAVPTYRQFRAMEGGEDGRGGDKVAEEAEKIADEVADTFSDNEMIKGAAAKIKAVADEIEEDADKAEALIEKVDEIMDEIDSIVDPIIDKVEKQSSKK